MKVLIVCQHFYPENFRINDISFELVKKGIDVTVLTGLPNYPKGKVLKEYKWFKNRNEVINGVKVKRCSLIGRGNSTFMMIINYLWFMIFASIKALFMKKDFDVVYVYQLSPITMAIPAIIVSKIKKIPLVIHCLDQWPISITTADIKKTSFIYKLLEKISRFIYNQADIITTSSKSFKKYFVKELKLTKEKKFLYFPSYAEDNYSNIKYLKDKNFDLLFAGNIGPAQSVETIVEAANLLKKETNIKFHIVGDGLSKKECEDLAKKYKLKNIVFYGYHSVDKMPDFYKLADAFLITMVDNEVVNNTLPAKVQSYMVAKRPIIGAISGEVSDVIKEANCGLTCKSLDYKNLAKIIKEASTHKDLNKWGKNAEKYYQENFKKEKCINEMIDFLKKVCK
ncbi:MAG: glycosyltransferase family 4 protein [Mycoplasmatota bacterium]